MCQQLEGRDKECEILQGGESSVLEVLCKMLL
jgi:hypothetical protein